MRKTLLLLLVIIVLTSCTEKKTSSENIKVSLHESYDFIELYPKIARASRIAYKKQLDSIANISSGNPLIDTVRKQDAKSYSINEDFIEIKTFHIDKDYTPFPSWKRFVYWDTSAIIGVTADSLKFLKIVRKENQLFPNDLKWKISGKFFNNMKFIHALKKGYKTVSISPSEVDSIFLTSYGFKNKEFNNNIDLIEKLDYYWVEFKLKKELSDRLGQNIFTFMLEINNNEYTSSVVNFKNNPGQLITIGVLDYKDFEILKSKYKPIIKLKK